MKLTLTIINRDDLPPEVTRSRSVEAGQITLGRGADNDWTLPDPDRHLSKNHCAITAVGDGFTITDTSTNGVYVNRAATALGRGGQTKLADGDQLSMGDFEFAVRIEADGAVERTALSFDNDPFAAALAADFRSPAAQPTPPPSAPTGRIAPRPDPLDIDPFDGPSLSHRPDHPLPDSLFDDPTEPDPLAEIGPSDGSDFPFLDDPAPADHGHDSEDVLGRSRPADDWTAPTSSDHVPSEQEFFRPPDLQPAMIPDDWDEDPIVAPEPAAPISASPDPAPPPPPAPPATATASRAASPGTGPAGSADALVGAFFRGAGLEPPELTEDEAMQLLMEIGQSYREMVRGLRDVLMARSTIKNELRVERTMIRATENNPLKFSVSEEEALSALLLKRNPGFLAPVQAARQGFDDVKAHEMAVMAGMQAALAALLKQFDPAALTKRLEKTSFLSGMLPGSRKSRYWEAYEQHYRQIAGEALDDFQGWFGREFARAYEQQIRKL